MRPNRYICNGCARSQRNAVAVPYCTDCHQQYDRVRRLWRLICNRYPTLRGECLSDVLIRMWIKYVAGTHEKHEAEQLLNAKPEQLNLW